MATYTASRKRAAAAVAQCPHCDKTFAVRSGLASHVHYLHPDKLALKGPGPESRPPVKSGPEAPTVVSSNDGAQEQGNAKKLMCAYCGKAFGRPSSLSTHIRLTFGGFHFINGRFWVITEARAPNDVLVLALRRDKKTNREPYES